MTNRLIGQPVYYDYGTNVYYEGDSVYYDGEVIASADEYSQQAYDIANAVPEIQPDEVEWLPLGVFALNQKDDAASIDDATIFLQLAISKEGIIAGTVQNSATGNSFEIEGTIDAESQRAAFGPVGKNWPIMETAIYNLTKDDAGMLLHFEDGQTQQWHALRVAEPESESPELP